MATYSLGVPPTDATKQADLSSVLNLLPDNTSKLIAPKDVRDSVYTLWENIIFKPTTATGSTEYIGIDNESIQQKILFGKKTNGVGGYVMNNLLLNTDVDIFFFNTKSTANFDTKIAILGGTGTNTIGGNIAAPYLQATNVSNPGFANTLNLEITNPSYYLNGITAYGGDINIKSNNGVLSLNGIVWPTFSDNNTGVGYDSYVLKYKWIGGTPYAVWEPGSAASLSSSGTVSITGSPVLINGFDVAFSSAIPTPNTLGGIEAGSTFSSVPVTEMLRRLLYPYIGPSVTTSLNYQFLEVGDATTAALLSLSYTITLTSTYSLAALTNTGTFVPPIVSAGSVPQGTTTYTSQPVLGAALNTPSSLSWLVTATDTYPETATSSSSLETIYPWFYGTTTTTFSTAALINTVLGTSSTPVSNRLTPLLATPNYSALTATSSYNKTVNLSGNNVCIYFGYPSTYPDLTSILDQTNNNVFGSFQKYTLTNINSPRGFWTGQTYKFYIYVGPSGTVPLPTTIGSFPSYSAQYQFKFA